MKNVIIWDAKKFAKLATALKDESRRDTRIGYGNGYQSEAVSITVDDTPYTVRAVCSYASAMGVLITDEMTEASVLIVTDENHGVTATTAQHLGRLCKDNGFLTRYNLYPTRAGYEVNVGGCRMYYTRDRKDWKADGANGYTEFFKGMHDRNANLSDILNATNDALRHEWNKVTE